MGRFSLRLPESLHRHLEVMAEKEEISLNQYIVYALTKHTATAYQITQQSAVKIREQQTQYQTLLNHLGQPFADQDFDALLASVGDASAESDMPDELRQQAEQLLDKLKDEAAGHRN